MQQNPSDTVDSGRIRILDPRTGDEVRMLASAGPEEVADAVTRAAIAFPGWSSTAPAERGSALRSAAAAVSAAERELAELNERETGRPFGEALEGVRAGVATLEQYAELGPLHQGVSLRGEWSAVDFAIPEPRGVVAVITPWNDPVAIAAGLLGAAIVTGNTVVHKPSERSPSVGYRFAALVASALPPGVLEIVEGDGGTGATLTAHSGIAVIAHVGSTATGERISRVAALTGAHVVRENGGNDALIVDRDVDPTWAAAQAALGAFANAGQICTSVERIYVVEEIADDFLRELIREAETLTASGRLGPLVDERLRAAVHEQVVHAVEGAGRIATGGTIPDGPGTFYPATVVVDCPPGCDLVSEETFGPVAAVIRVASFEEALAHTSHDKYGLAATVLTRDLGHARRAIRELDVGTVKVNQVFGGAPGGSAQPRRASGAGFGYGPRLLDELTRIKVVHLSMEAGAPEAGE